MRINDFYNYRFLNLEKIAKSLTFVPGEDSWSCGKKSRLQVLDHLKQAKVPILKMRDKKTQIEFDISQGSSSVNNRHIQICRAALQKYQNFKTLVLVFKDYLKKRDCLGAFNGGISSFLLVYMVIVYL
jgi:DNA polymerase sigma